MYEVPRRAERQRQRMADDEVCYSPLQALDSIQLVEVSAAFKAK
jgi:hypothetical protein